MKRTIVSVMTGMAVLWLAVGGALAQDGSQPLTATLALDKSAYLYGNPMGESPRKRAELTLLELRQGEAEFDLGRLQAVPAPPLPPQWPDHLVTIALAELDAQLDAAVAARRDAILRRFRREGSA